MRYIYALLLLLIVLPSCHTSRKLARKREAQRREHATVSANKDKNTTEEYIAAYKAIAIRQMRQYHIPASIILAQAILESANGNSDLARNANNHFGIKCTQDWEGKTYRHDDETTGACFRYYPNAEASYKDHSEFLKRSRYAALFDLDSRDYKGWARGLKKAGYATNPKYPQLLIALIEKYGLDKYDK